MYSIAILSGDGIGPEVMQEALKILDVLSKKFDHNFTLTEGLIGGAAYDEHQEHLPQETIRMCEAADAIPFGSVGGPVDAQEDPKWKDVEKNSLLGIRKHFNLAINLRPATVYPILSHLSPLKQTIIQQGIDMLIVRELIGGIYFGGHHTEANKATDTMIYTEEQILTPLTFAFQAAMGRRKKLTVVDKANVLDCSRLWRRITEDMKPLFPEVDVEYMYIDNAVMSVIKNPSHFDVIVTGNMFGDILSDAASVLPGSLGLMPSASLSNVTSGPTKDEATFGMYEPIGGSAPDIADKGIANPIAQILSVALMLRYSFGLEEEAQCIEQAVQTVLAEGARTGDIAQKGEPALRTSEIGDRIAEVIES